MAEITKKKINRYQKVKLFCHMKNFLKVKGKYYKLISWAKKDTTPIKYIYDPNFLK